MDTSYITNPIHGGKVTCHKCNDFIKEGEEIEWINIPPLSHLVYFHIECFNRYEHYYGLDKPID